MFGGKKILFFEKAIIITAILAGFLYSWNFFDSWAGPLKDYFFKTGRWEELAIITVFVFGIGYIIQYLARFALRMESSPKQRRR